ncbi:2-oxoacid:acceptor oxidoreductase family protein [Anaerotardibacter muris]|uniref:2-oxoacid:acceptor oxidoreductase family protein n=1 Tax=Anaerotardibacter muris TaxID=2941505 RepID=UPI00204054E9|nr:2-oxoacid:acceptor oxidoreductase family protein [Anaerotardibacter muris]
MINVSIAGIGGQGSVLAARILAQAAENKGWQVRSAETIGMAQRGGDVMSHVRMGNEGEAVFSPLPSKGSVDVLIALEPGEAARSLPYLKEKGLLVVASSGIAPVNASFKRRMYEPMVLIEDMKAAGVKMVVVDDTELVRRLGEPKALNVMMLAYAIIAVNKRPDCVDNALRGAISLEDIEQAIPACVKRKLVSTNEKAIKVVQQVARI